MFKTNFKKIFINSIIVFVIFLADRISKIYILKISELESSVNIYVTQYINFYLIWNKGIAFGLFSFNESFIYNVITFIIVTITIVILVMIIKNKGTIRLVSYTNSKRPARNLPIHLKIIITTNITPVNKKWVPDIFRYFIICLEKYLLVNKCRAIFLK